MENFNVEELKTAVGHIMLDLRGNWGFSYSDRMGTVCKLLETLIVKDPSNQEAYSGDLAVAIRELGDPCDGRIFRDCCKLYGYSSNEGRTQRVKDYLEGILTYPDDHQIEVYFEPSTEETR